MVTEPLGVHSDIKMSVINSAYAPLGSCWGAVVALAVHFISSDWCYVGSRSCFEPHGDARGSARDAWDRPLPTVVRVGCCAKAKAPSAAGAAKANARTAKPQPPNYYTVALPWYPCIGSGSGQKSCYYCVLLLESQSGKLEP